MNSQQHMASVLQSMCEGSEEAFQVFYQRYSAFVISIALKLLRDRMEAEDVCHDVFLEALRRGGQYDASRGSIEAWLAVMTRSRCLDRLRKSSRLIVENEPAKAQGVHSALPVPAAEAGALRRLALLDLQQALMKLPECQRQAIVRAYFAEDTQREMASRWQVPIGTVKSWVRYGLIGLRRALEKKGYMEGKNGGGLYEAD